MKMLNNENPLVSIICGYYNREQVVLESVLSLMNQSYRNIEIIIFDDCSTDKTYDRLMEVSAEDWRVKIIRHTKNKGFVRGIIEAIEYSSGEYIAIHGSGDLSFPDRIKRQAEVLMKRPEVGVVGCYLENVNISKEVAEVKIVQKELDGDAKELLLVENPFTHGEVMYRRDLYEKVGGYRELFTFTQDFDLWCRLSHHCDFYIVKEILYKRYLLPDGASVKLEKKLLQQMLREFGIQNHELRLKENRDLIDRYGFQSLFYFRYTKRFSNRIFYIAIKSFKIYGNTNPGMNELIKTIAEKTRDDFKIKTLKWIYFKFPPKFSLFLLSKRPFYWFLELF